MERRKDEVAGTAEVKTSESVKKVVRFSRQADNDLEQIWCYITIHGHNRPAADGLVNEIERTLFQVADFPEMGKMYEPLRERKLRHLTIRRRYQVFYRPIEDGILVLRVLHTAKLISPGDLDPLNQDSFNLVERD